MGYIVGHKEFYGLDFLVDCRVLIPRPDTELLVEIVVHRFAESEDVSILDVGTGSGCIAVALRHELPNARVIAGDISPDALEVCRQNSTRILGYEIETVKSDLLASIDGKFDCIVSNPPYLSEEEWRRCYGISWQEPKNALVAGCGSDAPVDARSRPGGGDCSGGMRGNGGLAIIDRLIEQSVDSLEDGGYFLLEASPDQTARIKKKLVQAGFKDITLYRDLAGRERAVGGSYGTFHAAI